MAVQHEPHKAVRVGAGELEVTQHPQRLHHTRPRLIGRGWRGGFTVTRQARIRSVQRAGDPLRIGAALLIAAKVAGDAKARVEDEVVVIDQPAILRSTEARAAVQATLCACQGHHAPTLRWLRDEMQRGNRQVVPLAMSSLSAGVSLIASVTATTLNGNEKLTADLLMLLRPQLLDMYDQHVINAHRAASRQSN